MSYNYYGYGSGAYGKTYVSSHATQWKADDFFRPGLDNMIEALVAFDQKMGELRARGGHISAIQDAIKSLKTPFRVRGTYGESSACLAEPDKVREALRYCGQYDVKFNVRRLPGGFPAYYLVRIHRDYWGAYSLIVEDLYRSPEYRFADNRFDRLMDAGRERFFLRLSEYYEPVAKLVAQENDNAAYNTNTTLYALGRCVFQGAWHVDQRLAFVMAQHLGLTWLRQAIELVYLCLSCDLCALRRFLTPTMLRFFEEIYPNEGIARLMARLDTMTGSHMSLLTDRASGAYRRLSRAVSEFLGAELRWSESHSERTPLWKIVFANFTRMDLVGLQLAHDEDLAAARNTLEACARNCADNLLEAVA